MRVALLLLALVTLAAAGAPTQTTTLVVKSTPDEAPTRGPRDALVVLEFFCNLTISQCAETHDLLVILAERHPERLRIVYRQSPFQFRDNQLIAEAALEAWRQGRFLEFIDLAYQGRGRLSLRDVDMVAHKAGVELGALHAALADRRHHPLVERDLLLRDQLGATTLPVLAWNGTLHTPPRRIEDFEAAYDAAYALAQRRLADGVPAVRLHAVLAREAARARLVSHPPDSRAAVDLSAPRAGVRTDGAPARGPETAEVIVVVFGDFECPLCRRQLDPLRRIEEQYPGHVRLVWKHLPLATHPNARAAAEAAVCAHRQGKFWPFHEALYRNFGRLGRADLVRAAAAVGLNLAAFTADLDAGRCAAAVDADLAEAKALGLDNTPSLFVNGLRLPGLRSLADLHTVVEEELSPGWLGAVTDP
jgi:protein-disulfide isomerase